jgi:hypothetical protein
MAVHLSFQKPTPERALWGGGMRRIETRDGRVFVHEPKCPLGLIRQSFIEALE